MWRLHGIITISGCILGGALMFLGTRYYPVGFAILISILFFSLIALITLLILAQVLKQPGITGFLAVMYGHFLVKLILAVGAFLFAMKVLGIGGLTLIFPFMSAYAVFAVVETLAMLKANRQSKV